MSLGLKEPSSPGIDTSAIVKQERLKYDFEIQSLERQIADEHAARVRAENKLAQVMSQKDSLESDSAAMYEKMLIERKDLEDKIKSYESEISKSCEQTSQTSLELNTVKADLVAKDLQVSELRLELGELQEKLSAIEYEREADRVAAERDQRLLQIDRDAKANDAESLRAQLDNLKRQSSSDEVVSGQLSEYVAKTRALEEELAKFRKAAHEGQLAKDLNLFLEEEKSQLKREIETLSASSKENRKLQEKLARLEAEKQVWTVYIRNHPDLTTPQDLAKRVSSLLVENKSLLNKLASLEREHMEKSKSDSDESVAKKQIELEEAQDELSEAKAALTRRNFEVENLRKEVKLLEAHIDKKSASDGLQTQLDQAAETIQGLQQQITDLEKARAEAVEGTVLKKRRVSEMMLSNRKDTDDKLKSLEQDLEVKTKELENARLDLESAKKTIEKLTLAEKESHAQVVEVKGSPFEIEVAPRLAKLAALEREVEDLRRAQEENSVPEYVPRSSLLTLKVEYDILKDKKSQLESKQNSLEKALSIKDARLNKAISQLFGYHMELLNDRSCLLKPTFNPGLVFEAQFDAIDRTYKNFRVTDDVRMFESLYKFWVQERKCLPAFLGAAVLEMVEENERRSLN